VVFYFIHSILSIIESIVVDIEDVGEELIWQVCLTNVPAARMSLQPKFPDALFQNWDLSVALLANYFLPVICWQQCDKIGLRPKISQIRDNKYII
jgi:hypothetical protein